MSTSRQNPDYPVDDSIRDAVALVTALLEDPRADSVGELALRNALEGTDHTYLAYHLGHAALMLAALLAAERGVPVTEVLQDLGAAVAQAIASLPPEGMSNDPR